MKEDFYKLPESIQEEILANTELKNEWRKLYFGKFQKVVDSQEVKQALKKMPKKEIIGMIVELVEKGRLSIWDLEELN